MEIELKKETIYQLEKVPTIQPEKLIQPEKYSAVIEIGDLHIQLTNKTFTKRQIKHMKKYFGWEVRNIDES